MNPFRLLAKVVIEILMIPILLVSAFGFIPLLIFGFFALLAIAFAVAFWPFLVLGAILFMAYRFFKGPPPSAPKKRRYRVVDVVVQREAEGKPAPLVLVALVSPSAGISTTRPSN